MPLHKETKLNPKGRQLCLVPQQTLYYFYLVLFSALNSFSYNPSSGLYSRLRFREDSNYMFSMYLYFYCLFGMIFFSHTEMSCFVKCIFCISYRLGLPGIFLMCLSVHHLIILRTPIITGTMVVLRGHIFFNFYFQVFVFAYFIIFFD